MNGQRRQAIGNHHRHIDAAREGQRVVTQLLRRGLIELAAQVGALQVAVTVNRGAVQLQAFAAALGQLCA